MSRRPPTIAAEAAARARPTLVSFTHWTTEALAVLTASCVLAIAAAVAWHLTVWAWRAPEQPLVLALVAALGYGVYYWDRRAAAATTEPES